MPRTAEAGRDEAEKRDHPEGARDERSHLGRHGREHPGAGGGPAAGLLASNAGDPQEHDQRPAVAQPMQDEHHAHDCPDGLIGHGRAEPRSAGDRGRSRPSAHGTRDLTADLRPFGLSGRTVRPVGHGITAEGDDVVVTSSPVPGAWIRLGWRSHVEPTRHVRLPHDRLSHPVRPAQRRDRGHPCLTAASRARTIFARPRVGVRGWPPGLVGCLTLLAIGWTGLLIPSLIRSIEATFGQTDAGMGIVSGLRLASGVGVVRRQFADQRLGRRRSWAAPCSSTVSASPVSGWPRHGRRPGGRGRGGCRSRSSGRRCQRPGPGRVPRGPGPGGEPASLSSHRGPRRAAHHATLVASRVRRRPSPSPRARRLALAVAYTIVPMPAGVGRPTCGHAALGVTARSRATAATSRPLLLLGIASPTLRRVQVDVSSWSCASWSRTADDGSPRPVPVLGGAGRRRSSRPPLPTGSTT